MKKFRILVSALLVLSICLSFCGCGSSAAKYTVKYTDGSVHQLTSEKIIELYNQEPTRDNPNPRDLIKGATISGTGTITKFDCDDSESIDDYMYACDYYAIEIDDSVHLTFRIQKDSGVKLQFYVGDKVNFIGKLVSYDADITSVNIHPLDGYHLPLGDGTGITLIE